MSQSVPTIPAAGNFALLRLLVAALAILSHVFIAVSGTPATDPARLWTGLGFADHALIAMAVMSGFLLPWSLERSANPLRFMVGRIVRLVPAFLVALVVLFFVVGPFLSGIPLRIYLGAPHVQEGLLRLAVLQDGTAALPYLYEHTPAGTLALVTASLLPWLMAGGAVVLALTHLPAQVRTPVAFGAAAALIGTTWIVPPPDPTGLQAGVIPGSMLAAMGAAFLFGLSAWHARHMVVLDRRIALALVALAAATAGWPIYLVTVTVALSYGVLVLALATKPIGAAFFRDVDLSYGMLLYGWPLTQFIVAHEPFAPVGSIATLALLATAGMAVLSWRLVEQPAIRFGRFLTAGYDRRADVALRSAQAFRTRP